MPDQWFRVYNSIRHDRKVCRLRADVFKAWICLLSLASEGDGKIPTDLDDLAFELHISFSKIKPIIDALVNCGLLERHETFLHPHNWSGRQFKSDVSTDRVRQFRERHAKLKGNVSETRPYTESDTETEKREPNGSSSDKSDPPSQAIQIYHEETGALKWPKVQKLTKQRRSSLNARLSECGGLDGWREQLKRAVASDFLSGRMERTNGHANWTPDIDFFLQQKSFVHLLEGKYDNRNGNGAASQKSWADQVAELERASKC